MVPYEKVHGEVQGGMCRLAAAAFPDRRDARRFHPGDGQLYCCGMFAWAGNRKQPGGFYRVRYTGQPLWVPLALHARRRGLEVTLSAAVDAASARDPAHYSVKVWSLKRSAEYGSKHYNEHALSVTGVHVSPDAKTLLLEIPALGPTMCMELRYFLKGPHGEPVEGVLHHTIHQLGN